MVNGTEAFFGNRLVLVAGTRLPGETVGDDRDDPDEDNLYPWLRSENEYRLHIILIVDANCKLNLGC